MKYKYLTIEKREKIQEMLWQKGDWVVANPSIILGLSFLPTDYLCKEIG